MDSLWPEDIVEGGSIRSPAYILKDQASELARLTKNVILGEVKRIANIDHPGVGYSFNIRAPVINYRFGLFTIVYNILDMYPIVMVIDQDIYQELYPETESTNRILEDESDFKYELAKIFNSAKTKRIIKSLMSESGATMKKGDKV